ncbi:MAG: GAF domain-containing protein [Chloroflexi bacterium]|nr:MAG: GAF domain-containing protein [Chloroflexota bacterium]
MKIGNRSLSEKTNKLQESSPALQQALQRRLHAMGVLEQVILKLQSKMTDEDEVLQTIVDAVVEDLGYKGAMVATLEHGNALPVRAFSLNGASNVLSMLEDKAGITLIGPKSAVYLDDDHYKDNLSVRAVKGGKNGRPQKYVTSNSLYDLFRPIAGRALSETAQRLFNIKQVIAVPFYLEDEVVGNLFVASSNKSFSEWEVSLLTTFGQQAAAGIRNARLYLEAKRQQEIAKMFGRLAVSATASVHALGNHMSAAYTFVQMLTVVTNFPQEQKDEVLANSPAILERLNQANKLLENLHEPWQQISDNPVNVNESLNSGLLEVFPEILHKDKKEGILTGGGIQIHRDFQPDLNMVSTAPDMLTEAFRVIIRNAAEAIRAKGQDRHIWLTSKNIDSDLIQIEIRDSGVGIQPDDLRHIFEMGWSTKGKNGMGFGLFWAQFYIQGLNGRIHVSSTPDQGTTFTIQLPVAKEENNEL